MCCLLRAISKRAFSLSSSHAHFLTRNQTIMLSSFCLPPTCLKILFHEELFDEEDSRKNNSIQIKKLYHNQPHNLSMKGKVIHNQRNHEGRVTAINCAGMQRKLYHAIWSFRILGWNHIVFILLFVHLIILRIGRTRYL